MQKTAICLLISYALSGCSSSGSSSDSTTNGDTANLNTITGSTAGEAGTSGESGTSGDTGSTDGSSTDTEDTGTEATTGGGSTGQGTTGGGTRVPIDKFGGVSLGDIGDIELAAGFVSFDRTVDFSELLVQFSPTQDSCELSTLSIPGEAPNIDSIIANSEVNPISAGDVLTINSPNGSYAELIKQEMFGFTLYQLDEGVALSGPAPAGLTIDIPGDQFPAFSNVAFPQVNPLQVTSPSNLFQVTASTDFSWNASTNPDSFIEIFVVAQNADFTGTITLQCVVLDDGSFSFPAEIQAQLGSVTGIGSMSREAVNIVQSGSSLLSVTSYSEF